MNGARAGVLRRPATAADQWSAAATVRGQCLSRRACPAGGRLLIIALTGAVVFRTPARRPVGGGRAAAGLRKRSVSFAGRPLVRRTTIDT
jgi:hypothetical protein